ncbi:MAG: NAD(P)H-hydrate dehydratase [Bacteriovoracaceae bacterium]
MRIVNQKEMREIENIAQKEYHFTENLVIENLGLRGADFLQQKYLQDFHQEIVVLVGNGSNGSDGLSLARHIRKYDHPVRAFMLFPKKEWTTELSNQVYLAEAFGVKIQPYSHLEELESYFSQNGESLIIDAIFGTGVRLPLPNFLYDVIKMVNEMSHITVSVDIPTGVLCDTGAIQGNAIAAHLTLAIALPKMGHYVGDGAKLSGEVVTLDVGFPNELLAKGDKFLLTTDHLQALSEKKRSKFSHKYNFGHTLVLGGSFGMTGALHMAATASLRVGAGLVTAVTWEKYYHDLLVRLTPEIMTGFVPKDETRWAVEAKNLIKYDAIVIGPGLGKSERSRRLVIEVLNNFNGPVVLDADAINVLSLKDDHRIFAMRNAPTVLTPHYGEFSRFTGMSIKSVLEKPVEHLRELVETINCSVILKGPCTFLGSTNGNIYFNYSPNDGMAKAGSGDVLAGIIGGLFAQHFSHKDSKSLSKDYKTFDKITAMGVMVHSMAGKHAAKKWGVRSMSALSIIDALPEAFMELESE